MGLRNTTGCDTAWIWTRVSVVKPLTLRCSALDCCATRLSYHSLTMHGSACVSVSVTVWWAWWPGHDLFLRKPSLGRGSLGNHSPVTCGNRATANTQQIAGQWQHWRCTHTQVSCYRQSHRQTLWLPYQWSLGLLCHSLPHLVLMKCFYYGYIWLSDGLLVVRKS